MQDLFGSVRRSLALNPGSISIDDGGGGGRISGFVEKIGTSIRNSRIGLFTKPGRPALPPSGRRRGDDAPPIRWRKGELIGVGAFGRVYMGMNLDSGELLAVKQVLIATNSASKHKTQEHVRELEEEVKLLKNLSHPNIVRYLGTIREEDSLNILMEFVPGGSISSLLGKFESFSESVIRRYTKQLLLGLEYLHKNKILHRDIKGANILVDNKGCIKLADFGASKKVVELATINGAKSMKGTPYWMAPEVIVQSGYSFSADIWSVGCTIIEMATGKPPWSQQYQEEFAAMFHIGTTKSHPPIPENLSPEAKDFLLKCLQKEPHLRPNASELLQHPFVAGGYGVAHSVAVKDSLSTTWESSTRKSSKESLRCSEWCANNNSPDDDMCLIDDKDDEFLTKSSDLLGNNFNSIDVNQSFNPMSEPADEHSCNFGHSQVVGREESKASQFDFKPDESSFHGETALPLEDDDEVTESKIRAFLDEKALDLKKLQSPLYEEFYSTMNGLGTSTVITANPPVPKPHSPARFAGRRLSSAVDDDAGSRVLHEIQPCQHSNDTPSSGISEQRKKWEEELLQELERKRELMRKAGMGGKTPSPIAHRHRERSRFGK